MTTRIVIKNIFHMLSYGYKDLLKPMCAEIGTEEFDHIEDLFAAILNKWVSSQIKRGLHKQYLDCNDDIVFLRGQININGTINNRLKKRLLLSCDFSELTENCTLNRIIKSSMILLLKVPKVSQEQKKALRKNLPFLSTIASIDLFRFDWTSIHFNRGNYQYHWPILVCYFLVQSSLPNMTDKVEKTRLSIDKCLSSLYERFVFNYLKIESKKYHGVSVDSGEIPWNITNRESSSQLDLLPLMNVDIRLKLDNKILIIDAKYYSRVFQENFGTKKFHSNNLYQIFTYVHNEKEVKNTSGMLLYARTNDKLVADGAFWINGYSFSVKTLDLNCEFKEIKLQLDTILQRFVEG